jgi:hypothetical protein
MIDRKQVSDSNPGPVFAKKGYEMKYIGLALVLCLGFTLFSRDIEFTEVPLGGNSWIINPEVEVETMITDSGVTNWISTDTIIKTWFHLEKAGKIRVDLKTGYNSGVSRIKYTLAGKTGEINHTDNEPTIMNLGDYYFAEAGYHALELQGVDFSGTEFINIESLLLFPVTDVGKISCVSDEYYWGRRGSSVHLNYQVPDEVDVKWFYNEITVPTGNDVVGSYFMANGFGEGYFGIQVNSENERRILFSVWSPYQTDNPDEIPQDQRIKLLAKGKDVYAGKFGNEGSGGQSYKRYNWKAGITYRFLLRGEPTSSNTSVYTAWFYAPEKGEWELIASFERPQTSTWLARLHSFLENFIPEAGYIGRECHYSNQWICDSNGKWHEITNTMFTADNTAAKGARLDYQGGLKNNSFYLKNCGFFNETTDFYKIFTREETSLPPNIDFSKLPED